MTGYREILMITVLVTSGLFPAAGKAQDAHYWTLQYGTRSTLLGGSVIGSVEDLGATYYNPARLALTPDLSFLLSAKVYQWDKVTVEDGAGEGVDARTSSFGGAPSLVAGTFKIGFLPGHHFAYSFLTRQRSELNLGIAGGGIADIIETIPGDELFATEFEVDLKIKDEWIGFSWAHAAGAKASFGITQFLSIRSQNSSFRRLSEALTTTNETVLAIQINEYHYETKGFLWKAGFALDLKYLSVGATLTTPRLNLTGSGSTLFNDAFSGADLDGDGTQDDRLSARQEKDIDAEYQSSWALGVGGALKLGRNKLHFSAEWYDAVKEFSIMEPESFVSQSTGETISRRLIQKLRAVLNYGIGLEVYLNEKVSGYGSFATDRSAAPEDVGRIVNLTDTQTNASTAGWDLYHVAGGASVKVGRGEVTLGFTWSFGNQDIPQTMDFFDPGGGAIQFETQEAATSKLKFRRWKYIFGFSVEF
ncbi:hypothetical protein IH824_02740 [candidate division KSB1 bacterium]|nr:hypothetical protein [candidate division KSB1 bacterium]